MGPPPTEIESASRPAAVESDDRPNRRPERALGVFKIVAFTALAAAGDAALLLINQGEEIIAGNVTWAHALQAGLLLILLLATLVYFSHSTD